MQYVDALETRASCGAACTLEFFRRTNASSSWRMGDRGSS